MKCFDLLILRYTKYVIGINAITRRIAAFRVSPAEVESENLPTLLPLADRCIALHLYRYGLKRGNFPAKQILSSKQTLTIPVAGVIGKCKAADPLLCRGSCRLLTYVPLINRSAATSIQ